MAGHGHQPIQIHGRFPVSPIHRWTSPLRRFLAIQSSSGILLVLCTLLALGLANSPYAEQFAAIWQLPCEIGMGSWSLKKSLLLVVNDGLMTVFFFVIGLEIKREIVSGELRQLKNAILPIVAALGGMVAPALAYLLLYYGLQMPTAAYSGWAIPMATDIAFVVGILALFGERVPFNLRVLLLTLAIVDDLGAVLIIAFVFTEKLLWSYLAVAGGALVLTWIMNRAGVRQVGLYLVVGIVVWYCVLKGGIHPTIAGVILGLMTPSRSWIATRSLLEILDDFVDQVRGRVSSGIPPEEIPSATAVTQARFAVTESTSPLERLEHMLHPWMAFVIMPIFALANAGVPIEMQALTQPVALAVAAGLALGKPLGILLFCGIAVRLGLASLPSGVNWMFLAGGAALAGIGFTMSLFLAGLALPADMLNAGKIGTLLGSLVSTVLGTILLLSAGSASKTNMASSA